MILVNYFVAQDWKEESGDSLSVVARGILSTMKAKVQEHLGTAKTLHNIADEVQAKSNAAKSLKQVNEMLKLLGMNNGLQCLDLQAKDIMLFRRLHPGMVLQA